MLNFKDCTHEAAHSGLDSTEDPWPIPSIPSQLSMFAFAVLAIYILGVPGVVIAYAVAIFVPTENVFSLAQRGDYLPVFCVWVATMTAVNLDGLSVMVGFGEGQMGLGLVVATMGCLLVRFASIPREYVTGLYLWSGLIVLRLFSMTSSEQFVSNLLRYMSSFSALALIITFFGSTRIRSAYAEKCALLICTLAGHYLLEMLMPGSAISISSTSEDGITGRAAGLYYNANNAGVAPVSMLMLICMFCPVSRLSQKRNSRLMCLCIICGVAVMLTFSRQAMIALLCPLLMATWRISRGSFRTTLIRFPLLCLVTIPIIFSTVAIMEELGYELSHAAKSRYLAMRSLVLPSEDASTGLAIEGYDRYDNMMVSYELWSKPTFLGYGFRAAIGQDDEFTVHNQFLFLLIECGVLGVGLFTLVVGLILRVWHVRSASSALECCICLLFFVFLCWGTFNLFDFRFFAIPVALLFWAGHAISITDS